MRADIDRRFWLDKPKILICITWWVTSPTRLRLGQQPYTDLGNVKGKLEQLWLSEGLLVDFEVALQRAVLHKLHHEANLGLLDHPFDLHDVGVCQFLKQSGTVSRESVYSIIIKTL